MTHRRWFLPAVASAIVAAAAIGVAAPGLAATGGSAARLAPRASCTHLWAVVSGNGVLERAGCKGTVIGHPTTGGYDVSFPVSVRHCAWIATLGGFGTGPIPPPGEVTVIGDVLSSQIVFVATFSVVGTATDRGFHIVAQC